MKKWILVPLLLGVIIFGLSIGLKFETIEQPNNIIESNEPNELDILRLSLVAEFESQFVYHLNLNKEMWNKVEVLKSELKKSKDIQSSLSDRLWKLEFAEQNEPDEHDVVNNILNANVYVAAYNANNFLMWQGSGTIITSDGLVLTAGHVIGDDWEKPDHFEIELFDGKKFTSGDFVRRNDVDLGFIQIDSNDIFNFIDVFETEVDYIDEVYICGNPYGYECRFNITKGVISGLNRDFEGFFGDYYMIQSDAQSQPGNSGGGVFNMQGEIVGVLVGGYQGVDGMSLIIPSEVIVKVLECYNDEMLLEELKI